MKPAKNVDDYIKNFPPEIQKQLKQMRSIVNEAAPDATEKISYAMPTLFMNGNLVHYAAYKNHIGFYPTPSGIRAFMEEISKFKNSKGAVQFPVNRPLPAGLIKKIVKFRVKENRSRPEKKSS